MPELPEVETVVRNYRPLLEGRTVAGFTTRWPKNCLPSAAAVRRGIVGRTILRVSRRAKYIVLALDNGAHQLIHLRMSGRFAWAADHEKVETPFVRAVWTFTDGHALWFDDARKFGKIVHAPDLAAATAHLGVEPLDRTFTAGRLATLLTRRARQLKPLLLDQSVIAGLGNIYVDEALHMAGLHPLTRSDRLTPAQISALCKSIRTVLRTSIRRNGTTFDWIYPSGQMQNYLKVYGRTGEPCRRCRTAITYLKVAQRGTHICPACQLTAPR